MLKNKSQVFCSINIVLACFCLQNVSFLVKIEGCFDKTNEKKNCMVTKSKPGTARVGAPLKAQKSIFFTYAKLHFC